MVDNDARPQMSPSIQEQARVATVLYDMLMRGAAIDDVTVMHLSAAYPASAALAHQCARRGRQAVMAEDQPRANSSVQEQQSLSTSPRTSVVHRVSIFSVASFCGWLALILALSKVVFAALLAFTTTIARDAHPEFAEQILQMAETIVGTGRGLRLYQTLLEFAEMQMGNGTVPISSVASSVNQAMYFALWFPVGAGLLATITGAATAYCINVALVLCGGFRFVHQAG